MRDTRAQRPPGRLRKRAEFVAAASGRRFHTERMTVQGRLRDDDTGLRFGLTVTKRVGHATERNRIRRRLRAAISAAAGAHMERNADIVVIGRRDSLTAPYMVLVDDLDRALRAVTKAPSARARRPLPESGGERRGSFHA
jgi:ribonuclease P protein component